LPEESGIDYRPLVKIIEGAVYVPVKSYPIKHQTSEQQRQVRRYLCEAEQIHELQQAVRKSADPIRSKELRKLVVSRGLTPSSNPRSSARWYPFRPRQRLLLQEAWNTKSWKPLTR